MKYPPGTTSFATVLMILTAGVIFDFGIFQLHGVVFSIRDTELQKKSLIYSIIIIIDPIMVSYKPVS